MTIDINWMIILLLCGYHAFLIMIGYGFALIMFMRDDEVQRVKKGFVVVEKDFLDGLIAKLKKNTRYDRPIASIEDPDD